MTVSGSVTRSLLCSAPARSRHLSRVLKGFAGLKLSEGSKVSIRKTIAWFTATMSSTNRCRAPV